jgi:hypothetical protein
MKKIIFCLIFAFILTISVFAQNPSQATPMTRQRDIATINIIRSESITVAQLQAEIARIEKNPAERQELMMLLRMSLNGREPTQLEYREHILNSLVNEKLLLQDAEKENIRLNDSEMNSHITQLRRMIEQNTGVKELTTEQFNMVLRTQFGAANEEQYRKQLVLQRYLDKKKKNLIESYADPTDEEIKKFFEDNRADLFTRPQTVKLSAIGFPFGADATTRARARTEIDRLAREIGSSDAKFEEMFHRGKLPNSPFKSADDIYITRDDQARRMAGSDFVNAVFELRKDQISRVITGTDGYYIVKALTFYPPVLLNLEDIYRLGVPMTVNDFIGSNLAQRKQQEIFAQATQEVLEELRGRKGAVTVFNDRLNW